MNEYMNMSII